MISSAIMFQTILCVLSESVPETAVAILLSWIAPYQAVLALLAIGEVQFAGILSSLIAKLRPSYSSSDWQLMPQIRNKSELTAGPDGDAEASGIVVADMVRGIDSDSVSIQTPTNVRHKGSTRLGRTQTEF